MKIQSKEVAQTVNLYTKVFLEQKSKTFIIIQHHMTQKKKSAYCYSFIVSLKTNMFLVLYFSVPG